MDFSYIFFEFRRKRLVKRKLRNRSDKRPLRLQPPTIWTMVIPITLKLLLRVAKKAAARKRTRRKRSLATKEKATPKRVPVAKI